LSSVLGDIGVIVTMVVQTAFSVDILSLKRIIHAVVNARGKSPLTFHGC